MAHAARTHLKSARSHRALFVDLVPKKNNYEILRVFCDDTAANKDIHVINRRITRAKAER